MRFFNLLILISFLSSCTSTKLIVNSPTLRVHAKGNDDNINGAAITVRVRWDISENK